MEQIIGILVGAGAAISVLVEILKKSPLPTDKPKLIVALISLVVVIIANLKSFNLGNVDVMVAEIAAIYGSAIVVYETIIKPIVYRNK